MFLSERNMLYTGKFNSVLLLSHFVVVNINTANIDKVVSMLSCQLRSNADEHTLTQL